VVLKYLLSVVLARLGIDVSMLAVAIDACCCYRCLLLLSMLAVAIDACCCYRCLLMLSMIICPSVSSVVMIAVLVVMLE
jgi:hypothetical protein